MTGVLERWIRAWREMTSATADILLTLAVTALSLGALLGPTDTARVPATTLSVALILLGALPLVLRRRYPVMVLLVIELAVVLFLATTNPLDGGAFNGLGLGVALYTVANRTDRQTSLRIAALVAALNALVLLIDTALGKVGSLPSLFVATAVVVGSWSLGENVRTRRAYLAQLEERARRLELEREENAHRAVQEERTRIARELHDIVAHHVSAIAVQAGAAEEIAERDPRRAREVLQTIQGTSRQALAEMRAMLNVLRSGDEAGARRDPQPSVAHLERLVSQSRAAGLPVTLQVAGTERPLPEALAISAYRIVQEALTNSLRHAGPAHALVLVRYADEALELEINDDGRGPGVARDGASEGRGLVGMRERVALFGGDLVAGAVPGQGFRVRARLPLRQP
ncbi:MAG TPA: sensor histidine kinase [Chloroflexota bacterium]|nr:sensor histidine kinase [Chloroflexota bacterium]